MKHKKTSLASAVILAAGTQFAGAVPTLYLDDGAGNTVLLVDGGAAVTTGTATAGSDLAALGGAVTYIGSMGFWSFNVTTGISDPVTTAPFPHLDINSVNSSTAGATLTMLWSDTDFGPNPGQSMHLKIGGTLAPGGTLAYSVYGDAGNAALATTTLLGSLGPFGPGGAFSGTGGSILGLGGLGVPYSITQKIVLTHVGAGGSSFDAETQVPDGGTTLALLGCSMLGLGSLRRKFSNR